MRGNCSTCGFGKTKFGMCGPNCRCPTCSTMGFGTKQIKGYSSLSKKDLELFLERHSFMDIQGTKDKLFNFIKKQYPSISPGDIKTCNSEKILYPVLKAKKEQAVALEKELKEKAKLAKIKKVLYAPRLERSESVDVYKRLPAGSKVVRHKISKVTAEQMDDLADMFASTSASGYDPTLDLMSNMKLSFGSSCSKKYGFGSSCSKKYGFGSSCNRKNGFGG